VKWSLADGLASRKIVFAFLMLVTFVVYGNTFWNDWTYDDIPVVVNNTDIRSLENFADNSYQGRPLRELSYMLDYKLFGDEPSGYHLQQNLWHAANGFLLFLVMGLLGVSPGYALLGALVFLVHPLQVESVASIGHRKELLPLFFGFLTIYGHAKALTASGYRRWLLWLGCLVSYALLLLGNVTAGTLPLLLPVYEWLFVEKRQRVLARYPALCGAVIVAAILAVSVYYAQNFNFQQALLKTYAQNGYTGPPGILPMLWVVFKAPVLYLEKLFWPFSLAPEYVVRFSADSVQWLGIVGISFLGGLLAACWVFRRTIPAVSFAIAWCLVMYVPVANLLPVYAYAMADRYLYMILPGVGMMVAAGLQKVHLRSINITAAVLLVGLSVLTVVQNVYWRNESTLWNHAVQVNPESKGATWSLAVTQREDGALLDAKKNFERVLELDRFFVRAHLELAKINERLGDATEAKKHYELFVRYAQYQFPVEALQVKRYLQLKYP